MIPRMRLAALFGFMVLVANPGEAVSQVRTPVAEAPEPAMHPWVILSPIRAGPMPILDNPDPGGGIRPANDSIQAYIGSREVFTCLGKGHNVALVGAGELLSAYCWEPSPPTAAANVSAAIACWNRNGSIASKGSALVCLDTPEDLRRALQRATALHPPRSGDK